MNCVKECEYCKSITCQLDGPNCSIAGYVCTKLNKFVLIDRPIEKDCPFYSPPFTYSDLVQFKFKLLEELDGLGKFRGYNKMVTEIKEVINLQFEIFFESKNINK